MKKILFGLLVFASISAFSKENISVLNTVEVVATDYYGLYCVQKLNSIRCSGKSALDGFVATENLKKNKIKLSFKIFGDGKKAYNNISEMFLGGVIVGALINKTEKDILSGGSCSAFKNSSIMIGSTSWMKSKCSDHSGQKATVKFVYKDILKFSSLKHGWDPNGTYVKKIIINY